MSDWLTALTELGEEHSVLVSVADSRGSVPREPGTKMVVTASECLGTIGGGNLEFKAIEIAREMLSSDATQQNCQSYLRRFPLGPSLGQCCGGVAVLLFEPISATKPAWLEILQGLRRDGQTAMMVSQVNQTGKLIVTTNTCSGELNALSSARQASAVAKARALLQGSMSTLLDDEWLFELVKPHDFHITLFGAGHVGKALVNVLSGLPCTIDWVDSRSDQFPRHLPANVNIRLSDEPEFEVDDAPRGDYFLIMTHSHPLDQAICERVLERGDHAYCGLIGSMSKLRKFQKRMQMHGLSEQQLAALTCPIGVDGISGKHPTEIAIAVAAQLLQVRERLSCAAQASVAA